MSAYSSVSNLFKIALIGAVGMGFLAVGIFMFGQFFKLIIEFKEIQSWDTAPARILSAELIVDKASRKNEGDTYSVSASYSYIYERDFYKSDTVYPSSSSDNFGTYHQDNAELLKRHMASGENYDCFVNPDLPVESVLFNDLRFSMVFFHLLFITAFGGGGFCSLYILLNPAWKFLIGHIKKLDDKPWLLTRKWRSPKVGTKMTLSSIILFVASLLGVTLFVLATIFYIYLFGITFTTKFSVLVVFTLLFLFLAVIELKLFKTWNQKKRIFIHLDPHPGKIGGKIEGTFVIPFQLTDCDQLNVSLKNRVAIVTPKGISGYEYLYEKEFTILAKEFISRDNQIMAPFKFDIPQTAKPSRAFNLLTGSSIWFLNLKFKDGKNRFEFKFDVPVF